MAAKTERTLGLFGAVGVGVGAIVGGGILALAGAAFAVTGPAAIVAFALNGLIAILTALSFAEMSSKFPESGGTYTFSKKVLSVEVAFTVGWIVWFASIVAAVLYAIGFAHFAAMFVVEIASSLNLPLPDWFSTTPAVRGIALVTTLAISLGLMFRSQGGGSWANIGKVTVFAILIVAGIWACLSQSPQRTGSNLSPFFTNGLTGLFQAMGYSFIALQGFDLISAVGGEVRNPTRNIPRAMILSLMIALVIYLPLLFVLTAAGTTQGQTVAEMAAADPEGIVAVAAQNYLGPFGFWLVVVAAVLSMFSALQANLLAASRISMVMARDRVLPAVLSRIHRRAGTPRIAIVITGLLVLLVIVLLPDVAAAGAASSLIFLITFAVAHGLSILVRHRSSLRPPPFRTPLFPLIPVVGGLACLALAIFQGLAVPAAGLITVVWLGLGGLLFLGLFARRARVRDASSTANNPELMTLRGRTPLVLVPIANPRNASGMISLADALVPTGYGRVLMQYVVVASKDWKPSEDATPIERSAEITQELIRACADSGIAAELLMTTASRPMQEIGRVARLHRCSSLVMGMSPLIEEESTSQLEALLAQLHCNVVLLKARENWELDSAHRILVPVAGRGGHEHLLARLLGSLIRSQPRDITFLRVMRNNVPRDDVRRAKRELETLAVDIVDVVCNVHVVQSDDDPLETIREQAAESDLLVLGIQRLGRRQRIISTFTRRLAESTDCPIIVLSSQG